MTVPLNEQYALGFLEGFILFSLSITGNANNSACFVSLGGLGEL